MRTNSLATSRAKTQSVGNPQTPLSPPLVPHFTCPPTSPLHPLAQHPYLLTPLAMVGPSTALISLHSAGFTDRHQGTPLPPSPPLYVTTLRGLEGVSLRMNPTCQRRIGERQRGMAPWQTLVPPGTDSAFPPQITKPTRTQRRSFIPTSPSSPPSTARFSSLLLHWVSLTPLSCPPAPSPRIDGGPPPSLHTSTPQPHPTSGLPCPTDFKLSNPPLSHLQPKPREVKTRVQCHRGSDEGPGCLTPCLTSAPP